MNNNQLRRRQNNSVTTATKRSITSSEKGGVPPNCRLKAKHIGTTHIRPGRVPLRVASKRPAVTNIIDALELLSMPDFDELLSEALTPTSINQKLGDCTKKLEVFLQSWPEYAMRWKSLRKIEDKFTFQYSEFSRFLFLLCIHCLSHVLFKGRLA